MTLTEIAYIILEAITSNRIVDDEEYDIRLIKDLIKLKRATLLKQKANSGQQLSINNAQVIAVPLEKIDTYSSSQNKYPYSNLNVQDYQMYKSIDIIPRIVSGYSGLQVIELTSTDKMKIPFSYVPYGRLRVSGNGRFNKNLVFGAIKNDYLYFKDNQYFESDMNCELYAIFENPSAINGFNEDTDDYPCSLDIIDAIKDIITQREINLLRATIDDPDNDSNDPK